VTCHTINICIIGTSPVTYSGLKAGRYHVTIQAACPEQRIRNGPSKRARFSVRA